MELRIVGDVQLVLIFRVSLHLRLYQPKERHMIFIPLRDTRCFCLRYRRQRKSKAGAQVTNNPTRASLASVDQGIECNQKSVAILFGMRGPGYEED